MDENDFINFKHIEFLIKLVSSKTNHQWLCQTHNWAKRNYFSRIIKGNNGKTENIYKPEKKLIERVLKEMYKQSTEKPICIVIVLEIRKKLAPHFGFDTQFS